VIKDDSYAILTAAKEAEKAMDYLLAEAEAVEIAV